MIDNEHLHQLIELYFDGLTTLDQERELRRLLSTLSLPCSPEAEAAMAVMGYTSVMACPQKGVLDTRRRYNRMLRVAAAASVAVLTAVAIGWMGINSNARDNSCLAYVSGVKVSSTEEVMRLMDSQLNSISIAQDGIDEELQEQMNAISEIFNQL